MRASSRLAIAVHILALLELAKEAESSEWMAKSIGVHPVIVRNLIGRLRRAGLVASRQGAKGATLAKPADKITLLEVFHAVDDACSLFPIHSNPNEACPVGARIHSTLESTFGEVKDALFKRLSSVTMAELIGSLSEPAHN